MYFNPLQGFYHPECPTRPITRSSDLVGREFLAIKVFVNDGERASVLIDGGKNFIAISYGPGFLFPVPRPTNLGVVKSKRQKGTKKREKL
ncbi:MAG: hypothetical protein IJQ35_04980 [Bacteroidales bacterium]|nr:hypothetical protein [Bacteroidales bacterium]